MLVLKRFSRTLYHWHIRLEANYISARDDLFEPNGLEILSFKK